MIGCCADNCMNSDSKGFRMFKVPRDENRRKKWLENINKKNWLTNSSNVALCEVHFEDSMFEYMNGMMRLKGTAIPTIFTGNITTVSMNSIYDPPSSENILKKSEQLVMSTDVTDTKPTTNQTINYIVINTFENFVNIEVKKQLSSQINKETECGYRKRSFPFFNTTCPISMKQARY